MTTQTQIELGDRVEDKITHLKGIVIGITSWLYGCRRITVQPQAVKDNRPVDGFAADEPQLTLLKKGVIRPPEREVVLVPVPGVREPAKHGPRQDPKRRPELSRRPDAVR